MSIFKSSEKLASVIFPTSVLFCLVNAWYAAFDLITAASDWVASFHNIIDIMIHVFYRVCLLHSGNLLCFNLSLTSNVCIDDPLDEKH